MSVALAMPVAHALGAAVHENRQVVIDVLSPVIGPAIRKAITEGLRNFVAEVNGALESGFTPRGVRWRVEAWRSGVPYAQIVDEHTLNYRIDHVFLIERDSGLVLDRESAPHLTKLDADAIAGMLTAIGAFVRDSVGRDGSGTLDAARVGEHLLWIMRGPRANLACFIHGVPPAQLHTLLERRLEAIHARFGAGSYQVDDAARQSLRPDELMREVRAAHRSSAAESRWPVRIALLALLALFGWTMVRYGRTDAWIEGVRTRLAAHPGFVLTGLERHGNNVTVRGLLDPDAEPIATSLGNDADRVKVDTAGYVSTDDAIIAHRARRLLAAPDSATIAVNGGTLALGGSAAAEWIDDARVRAAWVPGVRGVEFSVVREGDAAALALAARAALAALAGSVPERRIAFVRETEPAPDAAPVLDAIIADAQRAQALAVTAGVAIAWIATGTGDDHGSAETNARVRDVRAHWLAGALGAHGVANVRTAADGDTAATDVPERSAFVRLVVQEPDR